MATLETINYGDTDEVFQFLNDDAPSLLACRGSSKFNYKAMEDLSVRAVENLSVCRAPYCVWLSGIAEGFRRLEPFCILNLCSQEKMEKLLKDLEFSQEEIIWDMIRAIKEAGGIFRFSSPSIHWVLWNEYDSVCNPERLLPRYKLTVRIPYSFPDQD